MNFFLSMMAVLSIFGFRSEKDPGSLLDKKIWEYSRILKATNNLQVSGTGGGLKDEKINLFMVNYALYKDVQLEEARINIVKLTEFYLHKINSDPELQSLLVITPFSVANLRLGIRYMQPLGEFSHEIANSFTKEGSVFYSKYNPINDTLERVHQETYEEALAIVNGKKALSKD